MSKRVALKAREIESTEILVEDRYAVDVALPLPQFDTVGAMALAARDVVNGRHKVYALVQRHGVPRRAAVVAKLKGRAVPGLLTMRAEGIIHLAARDGTGQRIVTIVDFPAGGPVVAAEALFAPVPERTLREHILPQLAATIAALENIGLVHRGISLRNLYYRDVDRRELVLGECFSAPPAYHQLPAYEPIDRALADPAGRGAGDASCDMYALGVTLMSLFLGRDVGVVAEGQELHQLEARLRAGSYWALGGSSELGGAIGELLRGLMEDNASKRWAPDEVVRWAGGLAGRRPVSDPGWTFVRPATFRDKSYKDRRALALAMLEAPREAVAFVYNDRFRHWVSKALSEGPTQDWLDRALDLRAPADGELSPSAQRMAVARFMAVFFAEGPLIYGDLRFCPDGIDYYLALIFADADGPRLEHLKELVSRGRLATLLEILAGRSPALKTGMARLASLAAEGSRPGLGHGLERCLYEQNKALPCQSQRLQAHHVTDLRGLMIALEVVAREGGAGSVIDPHVAAFALRCSANLEPSFTRLNAVADQKEAYLFETIRLLGLLQQKQYPQPLKALAMAFLPALQKPVEKLRSSSRRRQAMAALTALAEAGNLMRIATDLNLRSLKERDTRDFRAAQQQAVTLGKWRQRVEIPLTAQDPRVRSLGGRIAAWGGGAVLVITALAVFQRFDF